ncbi:unnamed protein product [Parajaminaea phylloscopi]
MSLVWPTHPWPRFDCCNGRGEIVSRHTTPRTWTETIAPNEAAAGKDIPSMQARELMPGLHADDGAVAQTLSSEATQDAASTSSASSGSSFHPVLPPSHPVAQKLRSILTRPTSRDEEELTRLGLQALEEMYAASEPSRTPVAGRSNRKTLRRSTKSSSRRYGTAEERHFDVTFAKQHFQQDAQKHLIASGEEYIRLLEEVDSVLAGVQQQVDTMRITCEEAEGQLSKAHDATHYLLEQATGLQRQSNNTAQQKVLLDLFLSRFTLTPEEEDAIQKKDSPVGSKLFAAMDRVQKIRGDCRALLEGGGEFGGGSRAGTDIMAQMSEHLEAAHGKLAKYLGFHFRQAPKEGLDVSRTLREAVRRLVDGNREDLLRPLLQVLASIRSSFLANTFYQALVQGASGSRPMELHAHDPLRYVGDMFAWVHQAVAGEREFLGQLFGEREEDGGRRVGERRRGINGSIDWTNSGREDAPAGGAAAPRQTSYMIETLDKCLEGCCRPLQLRVEQTIHAQEGSITIFQLMQLSSFYQEVMSNTLGSSAHLSQILTGLVGVAQQAFRATLDRLRTRLLATAETPDNELRPPPTILGAVNTLKELLSVHAASNSEQTSSAGSSEEAGGSDAGFIAAVQQLIATMLELIGAIENQAALQKSPLSATAAAVLRLNCVEHILSTTSQYSLLSGSVAELQNALDDNKARLVQAVHADLLSQSGLEPLVVVAEEPHGSVSTPSPEVPAAVVEKALSDFESGFLQSSSMAFLPSPLLSRLASPRTREEIHLKAMETFAQDYERVYGSYAEHGQTSGKGGWRTPAEVRMLLGV